jgi:ferric-dicitrate binding protein FerR (iron transport regulator)
MTLEELFYKYVHEDMTPGELRLFREMATREESRAELDRLFAQWINRDFPFSQTEDLDADALYLALVRRENIPVAAEPDGVSRQYPKSARRSLFIFGQRRILPLVTALAAACVLVVTGIFLFRRPVVPSSSLIAKAPVIVPATNKAILTLADGTHIELDNAATGSLAQQGNMEVVKTSGGQLLYRRAGGSEGNSGGGMGKEGGEGGNGLGTGKDGVAPVTYNMMTTPRGGYYQLILPDGSKVWLDAASSLRYPTAFSGKERSVELSGEAYFEIAPSDNQPFMVSSNGVTVQVLGTEFNMMAYSDEDAIRTTLVNGAVKVVCGNDREQIHPGQQASWARGGKEWKLSTPDLRQVLAWKQGEFRFQDLKIAAIMRQIARWYDVDVEFRGVLPGNEFDGVISRKKDVSELLTVLEQTEDVHFVLEGRRIIVEPMQGK